MNIVDKINWSKNCKKCLRPLLEYREIIGMSLRNWGSHSWRNPQFAIAVYRDICKWEAQHLEIWPLFALKIVLKTYDVWLFFSAFTFQIGSSSRVISSILIFTIFLIDFDKFIRYLRYLSKMYQKFISYTSEVNGKEITLYSELSVDFQCWTSFYSIYYCDVYGLVKSCNIGVECEHTTWISKGLPAT